MLVLSNFVFTIKSSFHVLSDAVVWYSVWNWIRSRAVFSSSWVWKQFYSSFRRMFSRLGLEWSYIEILKKQFYFVVVISVAQNSMWDFILLWVYEPSCTLFVIHYSQMSTGDTFFLWWINCIFPLVAFWGGFWGCFVWNTQYILAFSHHDERIT